MKYEALENFSGVISMVKGQVREIPNEDLAKDLMKAKLIKKYTVSTNKELEKENSRLIEELQKANEMIEELNKRIEELEKVTDETPENEVENETPENEVEK